MSKEKYSIGYLSGAPSVSTCPDAVTVGPRSHVLGVIKGFEALGWAVHPFIVGDRVPQGMVKKEARNAARSSVASRLLADFFRLVAGILNRRAALRHLPDVDFVYERFGSFQSLGRAFQKKGVRWVLETNGPFFSEANQERKSLQLSRLAYRMELAAYRRCDLLVCVSNPLKEILVKDLAIDPKKILVLPNGVDVDFFSPERVTPIRFFDFPVIGYVGAVLGRQGLDVLLRVLAEFKAEGTLIGLVVVGDGAFQEDLIELSQQLALADCVRFVGQVQREAVPAHIAGFDFGYSGQVAHSEGLLGKMYHSPLKLYEYLAMGKPVIASSYEDAQAVVRDGETGFLFAPGDPHALKRAISLAMGMKRQWAEMSKRARSEIVSHHTWEERVAQLAKTMSALKHSAASSDKD